MHSSTRCLRCDEHYELLMHRLSARGSLGLKTCSSAIIAPPTCSIESLLVDYRNNFQLRSEHVVLIVGCDRYLKVYKRTSKPVRNTCEMWSWMSKNSSTNSMRFLRSIITSSQTSTTSKALSRTSERNFDYLATTKHAASMEANCFLFSITFLFPWREFFGGETHQDSDETGYRSVEIVARSGNLLHKTQLTICACLTRSEVIEQTSIAMSPVNPMASWSPHQFDMHQTMATNR